MEELYQKNAELVYYFLLSYSKDPGLAEDLTQETFLQAMRSIDRYDGSCKISVWLCQIAKHLLYQYWEKHRMTVPIEQAWELPDRTDIEKQTLIRNELSEVLEDISQLPEILRQIIYLRAVQELSFRQIGELIGKTENYARVNFFRAKELLKKRRSEHESVEL